MARRNFGGEPAAWLMQAPSGVPGLFAKALASVTTGTFWSAQTGGTQYTDMLISGVASAVVKTDADGYIVRFQGPDGVNDGWVDFGTGVRFYVCAFDGKMLNGDLILNVKKDFGATGDGTTDDTAAIQAAITAAKAGGQYRTRTLWFPVGVYLITSAIDFGSLRVQGEGQATGINNTAPFGNSQWNTTSGFSGVVLKSTLTSGNAFTWGSYGALMNVMLLGPGSGTSVGLSGGSTILNVLHQRSHNLVIANFATGMYAEGTFFADHHDLWLQGNTTGLYLGSPTSVAISSVNTFTNINARDNATALSVHYATQNRFAGGCFQYNTVRAVLATASGSGNTVFDGVWFENPSTSSPSIDIQSGADGTMFIGGTYSSGDTLTIAANACWFLYPNRFSGALTNTGTGNAFMGRYIGFGTFTDSGSSTTLGDPFAVTQIGKDFKVLGKVGFNGNAPVAKAAAITTPNTQTASYVQADVASLKTAIDAIRVALQNVGITS